MEEIRCPSCGVVVPDGAASCPECETPFAPRPAHAVEDPVERVVVRRRSSSPGGIAFAIAGLVALLVVGFAMYELGRASDDESIELADTRTERVAPTETSSRPMRDVPPTQVQSPRSTPAASTYPAYPTAPSTIPSSGAASSTISSDRGASTRAEAADLAAYRTRVFPLLDEWDALVATLPTATSVTRDRAIERLREIEQRASNLTVPPAAAAAHGHLIAAMTSTIDAIRTAPTGEDPTATTAFMRGEELFDRFRSEVHSLEVSQR